MVDSFSIDKQYVNWLKKWDTFDQFLKIWINSLIFCFILYSSLPPLLSLQRLAVFDPGQKTSPGPQIRQHHLAKFVLHVNLLVVDENTVWEFGGEPFEKRTRRGAVDVDHDALGQKKCRQIVLDFSLGQFAS